jgi:ribonuclease HI
MEGVVAVYTDGGTIGWNGVGGSKQGGTWAWCGVDREGKRVVEKSGVLRPDSRYSELAVGVTNNHAEFFAIGNALRSLPDGWSGTLYTDSMTMVYRFQSARKRKVMKNTPELWQKAFWHHLRRLGKITVVHVQGHADVEHNCWCDEQCNLLAQLADFCDWMNGAEQDVRKNFSV